MLVVALRVDTQIGAPQLPICATASRRTNFGSNALEATSSTIVLVVSQIDARSATAALTRWTDLAALTAVIGVIAESHTIRPSATSQATARSRRTAPTGRGVGWAVLFTNALRADLSSSTDFPADAAVVSVVLQVNTSIRATIQTATRPACATATQGRSDRARGLARSIKAKFPALTGFSTGSAVVGVGFEIDTSAVAVGGGLRGARHHADPAKTALAIGADFVASAAMVGIALKVDTSILAACGGCDRTRGCALAARTALAVGTDFGAGSAMLGVALDIDARTVAIDGCLGRTVQDASAI